MDKDIQREIRKIINEIEDKSGDGDYIYLGEPKVHEEHPQLWESLLKSLA